MATGSDIVTDALFACGAYGQGDSLAAADAQLVLRRLNRMMAAWSNLRLSVFEEFVDTLSTVAGTQSYASSLLATGIRPTRVSTAYLTRSGVSTALELIDAQRWAALAVKATSGVPDVCYLQPSMPDSVFNLFPVPDAVYVLNVVQHRPLPQTITLSTTLALPPGYDGALVDCLAVDVAPAFGRPVTPDLRAAAQAARYVLNVANYVPRRMSTGLEGLAAASGACDSIVVL